MKGKLSSIAAILLVLFSQSFSSAKGKESPGPGSQENLTSPQPAISMPTAQNKISLDIKWMDVIDVIKILATRSGMNVVVGKNVSGRVTLFLKDVNPWDAFEIILLSNDLAYEKKGDIINVMTQRDYELLYGDR